MTLAHPSKSELPLSNPWKMDAMFILVQRFTDNFILFFYNFSKILTKLQYMAYFIFY